MEKRWSYKQRGEREVVGKLAALLCVNKDGAKADDLRTYEIIADLLVQRGITTYEEAEMFFRQIALVFRLQIDAPGDGVFKFHAGFLQDFRNMIFQKGRFP